MEATFKPFTAKSPLIKAILSDYRKDAIVPEGQYSVQFGTKCFKITVHDYTNLYFNTVNSVGNKGLIFIIPDYYRQCEISGVDYDPEDPELRKYDHTFTLCPHLLDLDENYEAVEDGYRVIVMTAVRVSDDEGNHVFPTGHTVPHGKPLDVVEMNWE